jgi:hypothetical protein
VVNCQYLAIKRVSRSASVVQVSVFFTSILFRITVYYFKILYVWFEFLFRLISYKFHRPNICNTGHRTFIINDTHVKSAGNIYTVTHARVRMVLRAILTLLGNGHQTPAWNLPMPDVQQKTLDDGQRSCPKHVVLWQNKFWIISASGWLLKSYFGVVHGFPQSFQKNSRITQ